MESPPAAPTFEWIDYDLSRWTFNTVDPSEQQRQFNYWCGWFGFDEDDVPEHAEGHVWLIRRRVILRR